MFISHSLRAAAFVLANFGLFFNSAAAQTSYEGIGRAAKPAEIRAWNIDVRPDFKGLPKGRGTVAQGEKLWEAKCASCHGVFGESNSVFNPIIGGTKQADIESGHVASLREDYPGRTTMMKLSSLSTLWDYINRAMPWNAPKTLTTDEVYASTAYILNLADVLPADFTLSDANMAEVQQRLPNRKGMTTKHALWPGSDSNKPDVQGSSCLKNCGPEVKVTSRIPDFARDAHGNLAEQNRLMGQQLGQITLASTPLDAANNARNEGNAAESIMKILNQNACTACHAAAQKLVGPSFNDVAKKYQDKSDSAAYLSNKIRAGGVGVWGQVPMPAQALSEADAASIAQWLLKQ
jgi:S-disulfanyl-L-cysteine oxidoreductase SoxD